MKAKILISLFVISIVTSLTVNSISSRSRTSDKKGVSENKIVTVLKAQTDIKVLQVDISGGIFFVNNQAGGLKHLIAQIDKAADNDGIKGLFIRANSPGGSIAASQELYESIKRFQETGKPIITSVMEICASGCYYSILPSNLVLANRGSIVGSIGVIMTTINLEELYKKIGIKRNNITSVEYKDILSPNRKMLPEELAHLKKMIGKMHEDFISDVILWREKHSSAKKLRETANGLFYTSDLALEKGLIDKIGDQRAAKKEMARLLQVDQEDINFIRPAYRYWEDLMKEVFSSFLAEWGINWMIKEDIPSFNY